jgi:hypothetical protein
MADVDEQDEEGCGTVRKPCTISVPIHRYLEKLAKAGTHGASVSAVMTFLIQQGVQQALEKGHISRE